ncbi:MAG: hypothetical protein ABL857_06375, partial [Rickettsiales bacterium]
MLGFGDDNVQQEQPSKGFFGGVWSAIKTGFKVLLGVVATVIGFNKIDKLRNTVDEYTGSLKLGTKIADLKDLNPFASPVSAAEIGKTTVITDKGTAYADNSRFTVDIDKVANDKERFAANTNPKTAATRNPIKDNIENQTTLFKAAEAIEARNLAIDDAKKSSSYTPEKTKFELKKLPDELDSIITQKSSRDWEGYSQTKKLKEVYSHLIDASSSKNDPKWDELATKHSTIDTKSIKASLESGDITQIKAALENTNKIIKNFNDNGNTVASSDFQKVRESLKNHEQLAVLSSFLSEENKTIITASEAANNSIKIHRDKVEQLKDGVGKNAEVLKAALSKGVTENTSETAPPQTGAKIDPVEAKKLID